MFYKVWLGARNSTMMMQSSTVLQDVSGSVFMGGGEGFLLSARCCAESYTCIISFLSLQQLQAIRVVLIDKTLEFREIKELPSGLDTGEEHLAIPGPIRNFRVLATAFC